MTITAETISCFDKNARKGNPMTALVGDAVALLDEPLTRHGPAVERVLEALWGILPKERMSIYRTETMRYEKPVGPRTLNIPKTWWRPGGRHREVRYFQVRDGGMPSQVPRCGLRISSYELEDGKPRLWEPSRVRFMLPAEAVAENPQPLLHIALTLANELPLLSGHAGYCIERSEFAEGQSLAAAYPLAMRYPGADIDYRLSDEEFDYLKTVNWLTTVGDRFLERIGGRAAVRARVDHPDVVVHDAKFGLIFQAGEAPALGDVNRGELLPAYRAVYRVLADLFASEFTPAFRLGVAALEDPEKTEAWYRRFADFT